MKPSRKNENKQSKQGFSNKPKPEIRDDMDSRKKKETQRIKPKENPDRKK